MTVVVAAATGTATGVFYDTAFERQHEQPMDGAHTRAGVVEQKGELAGFRGPFYRTAAVVLVVALLLIAASTLLFLRLTQPMIRALREPRERLHRILSATEEGIFGMDLEGRCTFANRAAIGMLGYDGETQLLGRDIHELIHHTQPDGSPHARADCPAARAIARGESLRLADEVLWRADGTSFPAEYRTRPIRSDGEIVGAVVSFTDLTESRRQELELAQASKMEVLGRLTGNIAHDFDDLLTVVLGNLRLLRRGLRKDEADSAELIDNALSAAENGADLTQRLLAFSREQTLKPEAIELGGFLREHRHFLQRTAGEAVEISLDTDTVPLPIRVDIRQLSNALLNLTTNACDAMPAGGGLRIAARRHEISPGETLDIANGPSVALSISDTGQGMAAELIAMAIEPFFTTKRPGEGCGLGLSMVYGFVRQSGGDLRIDSEPGGGTTVTLFFPEAEPRQDEAGVDAGEEGHQPAQADATILVVEHDARLRRFTARTLFDAGYRVLETDGASAARELLLKHPEIRLLFTDIGTPGDTGGLALAEWAVRNYPGTCLLLTTGYSDRAARARSLGFAILPRPYSDAELLSAVHDTLAARVSPDSVTNRA